MKPKIVKFKDGTYGVRRWTPMTGFLYLDLENTYWWPREKKYEVYYKGTLDAATAMRKKFLDSKLPSDKGEVVK